MTPRRAGRVVSITAVALLAVIGSGGWTAQAVPRPIIDPSLVPADGQPGPGQPMRQSSVCAHPVSAADPDVALPSPGHTMMNIETAWRYSTGHGVPVAVIDTGIQPHPRLPVRAGGDYVMGGDGLTDCDAHGTIVASIIAAAPLGAPMPPARPAQPAFPVPDGVPADAPSAPAATGHSSPPARVGSPDGVVGIAPHATLISIRQSSRAFRPRNPRPGEGETAEKAGTVATLARSIVHAANLGAKVINISVISCVPAAQNLDQRVLGAAVWYAATVKDAVIVAAAGNEGEDGCDRNPGAGQLPSGELRDQSRIRTISTPSWFSDYVLSVGAVDPTGAPLDKSLNGPWVRTAAPGTGIVGLSPITGDPVNSYPPARAGEPDVPFWGTSFSAAYVSGTAALIRARYPALSARQVINRILWTAHSPPLGVDNRIGYGVVDPVAALTFDIPSAAPASPRTSARALTPEPAPPPPDRRARNAAMALAGAVALGGVLWALAGKARRQL